MPINRRLFPAHKMQVNGWHNAVINRTFPSLHEKVRKSCKIRGKKPQENEHVIDSPGTGIFGTQFHDPKDVH